MAWPNLDMSQETEVPAYSADTRPRDVSAVSVALARGPDTRTEDEPCTESVQARRRHRPRLDAETFYTAAWQDGMCNDRSDGVAPTRFLRPRADCDVKVTFLKTEKERPAADDGSSAQKKSLLKLLFLRSWRASV